jgi:hypothetical protein
MSRHARKLGLLAVALLAALALVACGNEDTRVTTGTYAGESGANAPYLNVGPLVYEVQLSRELNPFDTEDSSYLQGIPAALRTPPQGQQWFAVFIQVYNNTHRAWPAATGMTISDTQGNVYTPVAPGPANQFAYRGGIVPPGGRLPVLDSVAAQGAIQGAMLLYRIQVVSLDNRPLKIHIVAPNDASQTASAVLDV